jgi:hypothetical protein
MKDREEPGKDPRQAGDGCQLFVGNVGLLPMSITSVRFDRNLTTFIIASLLCELARYERLV